MNTTKFFTKKQSPKDVFTLGGLCSFYQFSFLNVEIILLGEIHETMNRKLASMYIRVLEDFVNQYEIVEFLIEHIEGDERNNANQLSFLDSILFINSPHIAVSHVDRRYYCDGLIGVFLYFKSISELPFSNTSYFDSPQFIDLLQELAEDFNKELSFSDLFSLFSLERDNLIELGKKMMPSNELIHNYITTCIANIDKALTKLKALEKAIELANAPDDKKPSNSIIDQCITHLKQTKCFQIILDWLEIFYLYEIYHFDATLIMDLWQKLHQEQNNNQTIVIVSGNIHTEHLAKLLNEIGNPVNAMTLETQEHRIAPDTLNELLKESKGLSNRLV